MDKDKFIREVVKMVDLVPKHVDYMVKCMAGLINNGDIVYHGLASQLPVLAMVFAKESLKRDFIWVSVTESYMPLLEGIRITPSTGDPFSQKYSVGVVPTYEIFDLASQGKIDVMFFGAAQVDERGNTNLSVIGKYERPKVRLPGGAATAYLFTLVKRIIVWARHDRRTLVKKVDFVTGQGETRVKNGMKLYLCTSKGLIEYTKEGPVLRALFDDVSLDEFLDNMNMNVKVKEDIEIIEKPTDNEVKILNKYDPQGLRYRLGYE